MFRVLFLMVTAFVTYLFSETAELSVQIAEGANLEFTNFSILDSDFELEEDGSHLFEARSSWFYASNESGSTYKIQGRILTDLGSEWSLQAALLPPRSATSGPLGQSANFGNPIELTTIPKDFVTAIPQGRFGDLQEQVITLRATHDGFVEKADSAFNIVIEWTLMGE